MFDLLAEILTLVAYTVAGVIGGLLSLAALFAIVLIDGSIDDGHGGGFAVVAVFAYLGIPVFAMVGGMIGLAMGASRP